MKYADNLRYIVEAQNGDESALARLMEINIGLVRGVAYRFIGRGVELDDLIQIGSIGMLKAIRSFDLERGTAFSTYAVPLIIGEIRRFLRDDGLIKVGRRQKQTAAMLLSAQQRYIAEHGVEPSLSQLAEIQGISMEEAALALEAVSPIQSISSPLGDEAAFSLENILTGDNPIDRRIDQIALEEAVTRLPELWRKIIYLRFYREYSQQAVADSLGLTQVKISREEKKIYSELKKQLIE